ncbi:hypothetical protein EB093_01095 [bacterium]|nr:hypothetical protein [bacterium]
MNARNALAVLVSIVAAVHVMASPVNPPISAGQIISRTTATIGDQLTYELRVTYNSSVTIKKISDSAFKTPWVVVSFAKSRNSVGDVTVFSSKAVVSPFATGTITIPERTIDYVDNGHPGTCVVPEVVITVESVLSATSNQLQGIKRGDGLPIPFGAIVAIGVAVGAALSGGIIWALIRRRSNQPELEEVPVIDFRTPEQCATDSLDMLLQSDYSSVLFFTHLSDIVRRYLEQRFTISASEMTTFELEVALGKRIDSHWIERIIRVLNLCDLAKFAKYEPSAAEPSAAVEKIRSVIMALTPAIETEPNDHSE